MKKIEQDTLNNFLKGKKVLVVDTSLLLRERIERFLLSMGVEKGNLYVSSQFVEALEIIGKEKPPILISDYELDKKSGLDLIQEQRKNFTEPKKVLSVLTTGNTSQIAIARAVEGEVDSYIIKPFGLGIFSQALFKAVNAKVKPTQYQETIERGKESLAQSRLEEAAKLFEEARKFDPNPALACFFQAQVLIAQKNFPVAEEKFLEGLHFNRIHYRCLMGLYDLLYETKRYIDAYAVMKRVIHYFPADPQHLTAVLKLAILTHSYDDVERYYQVFLKVGKSNEELVKYICAALVVCGKHYLQRNVNSRAITLFREAAATVGTQPAKILREIITALIEHKLEGKVDEFLKQFPAGDSEAQDYLIVNYIISDKSENSYEIISKGKELLKRGCIDPMIYQILIRRLTESAKKEEAAQYTQEAIQKYPELKEILEPPKKAAPKT